jgi:predicted transposase YbfD/YdcC
MSSFLQQLNQNVEVFLSATWSRANLVCKVNRHWLFAHIEKWHQTCVLDTTKRQQRLP